MGVKSGQQARAADGGRQQDVAAEQQAEHALFAHGLPSVAAATAQFPIDYYVGRKEFRVLERISGARFRGIEIATERAVHLAHLSACEHTPAELESIFGYSFPGASPYLTAAGFYQASAQIAEDVVLVEVLPGGEPLSKVELDDATRAHVAVELARTVQHAARHGVGMLGLLPDLVYVQTAPSLHVTIMPRSWPFLGMRSKKHKYVGSGGSQSFTIDAAFIDPTLLMTRVPAADVYVLGLLLSWMYERKHPYATATRREQGDWLCGMQEGPRDPFTGPPALGELLGRMLLPDPAQRAPIDEIVRELEAMLRA